MRFPGGNSDPVHHVGIYIGKGYTIEGNTSSGTAGDQSNGGGVFKRKREANLVVGCARPRYRG
jgi:cell wall-associated NlpC family hydrolase